MVINAPAAAGVVDQSPHHRAPRVRPTDRRSGNRRRTARHDVRSDRQISDDLA
jgi:hypothetical protein